jgi:hypothetical protein
LTAGGNPRLEIYDVLSGTPRLFTREFRYR